MSETLQPVKDYDSAHPIATSWHPMISAVINAFTKDDFELNSNIVGVSSVPSAIAQHNRIYVMNYGEVLIDLTDESWNTSCAQWMGSHWDVLVDLCTEREGISDLVLTGKVFELENSFQFEVGLVYVP